VATIRSTPVPGQALPVIGAFLFFRRRLVKGFAASGITCHLSIEK